MRGFFLTVTFMAVIALLADYYIYSRIFRRQSSRRIWKIVYLVSALLVDTAVITAVLIFVNTGNAQSGDALRIVMWILGIFFLFTIPKLVYTLVSVWDYPVRWLSKHKSSRYFSFAGAALASVVALVMIHGLTLGRSVIRVSEVELHMERLPQSFDGLRVVHFSDNHIGSLMNRYVFLQRMVDIINGLEPDIVINSGDLVNIRADELDGRAMGILDGIESRYGVFSVPGNHDTGRYMRDTLNNPPTENLIRLIDRQNEMGWNFLINRSVLITNGADTISVTGLNYPENNVYRMSDPSLFGVDIEAAYANVPDSMFNITISHTPMLWDRILAETPADLTLAGHVHSMQIKFRLGSRAWSPAAWMYRRWSGLYEEDGRFLYVNDGMGYVLYPMRIGTKPEITLYILRSVNQG